MAKQYFQQRLFGIHLRQFREKHDISQFDVAVLVGCSPSHVSQLEKGKLSDHKMEFLLLLCDLMQVDFRDYISKFAEKF